MVQKPNFPKELYQRFFVSLGWDDEIKKDKKKGVRKIDDTWSKNNSIKLCFFIAKVLV